MTSTSVSNIRLLTLLVLLFTMGCTNLPTRVDSTDYLGPSCDGASRTLDCTGNWCSRESETGWRSWLSYYMNYYGYPMTETDEIPTPVVSANSGVDHGDTLRAAIQAFDAPPMH